ncbi:MAG: type II toxin-antitoxin system death-on-curing family toxin [Nitrosotalea sp.]
MTDSVGIIYLEENDIFLLRKGFKLHVFSYCRGREQYLVCTALPPWTDSLRRQDSLAAKAAFILFQIISSHPFIDGNKRTAYGASDVFLRLNGYHIRVEPEEALEFIVRIAAVKSDEATVRKWLRQHLKKLP